MADTRFCISRRIEDFLFLLEEKPRTRLELMYEHGFGGGTIKTLFEELKRRGIVEEFVDEKEKKTMLRLTEKGKKLVEKIRELYELLES
jgi:predicted transcriptional regulator